MPRRAGYSGVVRAVAVAVIAALPVGCITRPSSLSDNPFVGTWANQDRDRITFRQDTLVLDPSQGTAAAMAKDTCNGTFGFGYETKSRDALTGLIVRQSDLRDKLAALLARPDYPVAEMLCDQGYNTYVLLGDNDLLAIYRDGNIVGLDRLSRVATASGS
jgi:hypothetical protein